MYNLFLSEFFLLYFLMATVFITCLIQQVLAHTAHKKSDAWIWIGRIIASLTVIHFAVNIIGYDFLPLIKLILYIILLAVSLILVGKEATSSKYVLITAIVLTVLIVLLFNFLGPCIFTRIMAGDPYVSVYCPFTGISETYAYNFEPHFGIFIETKVHSIDYYGIHLGDWREIPNLYPIYTEYLD